MSEFGITVKDGSGGKRIELECEHQNGLLYVVPSQSSWVCSEELIHVHALAGFLGQLVAMDDFKVQELMQNWGIYFRSRPLSLDESSELLVE